MKAQDRITRAELLQWLDSEIAETVLLVDQQLKGKGADYIMQKTKTFTKLLKKGEKSKLQEIWRPGNN